MAAPAWAAAPGPTPGIRSARAACAVGGAARVRVDEEGGGAMTSDLNRAMDMTTNLLRDTLAASVLFAMLDLERRGGPQDADYEQARAFADPLAEQADNILFRSPRKGETAKLMTQLIRAVAVLAYAPGGVTIAGLHFDAGRPDSEGNVCCRSMGRRVNQ